MVASPLVVNLSDLDILHDRVRCPRCRRWADRLFLLAGWSLACYRCGSLTPAAREGSS